MRAPRDQKCKTATINYSVNYVFQFICTSETPWSYFQLQTIDMRALRFKSLNAHSSPITLFRRKLMKSLNACWDCKRFTTGHESNYIIDIQNSHWRINTNEWQQSGNFHCFWWGWQMKRRQLIRITPAFCPQVKIMSLYAYQATAYRINSCQRNPLMSCQSTCPRLNWKKAIFALTE